jgi:hypothetical protein
MASINKLKPGQTIYDVRRSTGFSIHKYDCWPVLVEEVNVEEGYIIARWNVVNPARVMYLSSIKRLRVKQPK